MDEHEAQVLGMLADLEAADAVPDSIRLANEQLFAAARRGEQIFAPPILARVLMEEQANG